MTLLPPGKYAGYKNTGRSALDWEKKMAVVKCGCKEAAPWISTFGSTYVIRCMRCGHNLTERFSPAKQTEEVAQLALKIEVAAAIALYPGELAWLQERRQAMPLAT